MQVLNVWLLVVALVVCCQAASVPQQEDEIIAMIEDVTNTNKDSEASQAARNRRSGVLSFLGSKLQSKVGLLGSLSSPAHYPESGPDYGPPVAYGHKTFNLWAFKKAIFGALLQAVKAITGGVIALKGQIIKVKGHLIAAKGHILQTKGEAISDFGRHIATKALLTPNHVPSSGTGYSPSSSGISSISSSGASSAYGVPAAPPPPPPPPPAPAPAPTATAITAPPPSGPSLPDSGYGVPPPSSEYGLPGPPKPSYGPPPDSGFGGGSLNGGYDGPVPPPGYGPPPSGFENHYQPFPPSGPSAEYGGPLKRESHSLPEGVQAGLLVLKPINVPMSEVNFEEFARSQKQPQKQQQTQQSRRNPASNRLRNQNGQY